MSGTYLPGDTRQRIQDLIKDNNITVYHKDCKALPCIHRLPSWRD